MKRAGKKNVTFEIRVPLTEREAKDLQEKLKCAILLLLPQRFRCEQVVVQPKVPPTGKK